MSVRGWVRAALAGSAAALLSLSLVACDTYHVKLQVGDCVDASTNAVDCANGAAVRRVAAVIRTEGAYPSCPPPLLAATFTEGGDGPMIGVAVCLGPLTGPGSS
jgi:hypothetical protein